MESTSTSRESEQDYLNKDGERKTVLIYYSCCLLQYARKYQELSGQEKCTKQEEFAFICCLNQILNLIQQFGAREDHWENFVLPSRKYLRQKGVETYPISADYEI